MSLASIVEPWHGTSGGYTNHACRCRDCRSAWSRTMESYRRRHNPYEKSKRTRTLQDRWRWLCPNCGAWGESITKPKFFRCLPCDGEADFRKGAPPELVIVQVKA